MSDIQLKPCPFCGGDGTFTYALTFGGTKVPYIECGECSASSCTFNSEEEAAESWNKRVSDE